MFPVRANQMRKNHNLVLQAVLKSALVRRASYLFLLLLMLIGARRILDTSFYRVLCSNKVYERLYCEKQFVRTLLLTPHFSQQVA